MGIWEVRLGTGIIYVLPPDASNAIKGLHKGIARTSGFITDDKTIPPVRTT